MTSLYVPHSLILALTALYVPHSLIMAVTALHVPHSLIMAVTALHVPHSDGTVAKGDQVRRIRGFKGFGIPNPRTTIGTQT